uniref:Circadian associated repressor of transcription a n=1 Tax=Esox lucius TaxID=8010 RepID=A0A3P8XCI3_ESOLU
MTCAANAPGDGQGRTVTRSSMSASDSKSTDWLASDEEDHEPQRERQTQQQTVHSPDSCCRTEMEEKKGETDESRAFSYGRSSHGAGSEERNHDWWGGDTLSCVSSQGFPPTSCTGHWETKASKDSLSDAQGLSPLILPSPTDTQSQPGQKRGQSSEVEHQQEQLMSERDRRFTVKCFQLQCYIPSLTAILTGLRSGRYKHRLSGFQQSVAIDRIQRIMGVLRNPRMGERYLNIMVKMEEMLRSWFPNVTRPEQWDIITNHTEETTIPNKKLKFEAPMPSTLISLDPVAISVAPADWATSLTSSGPYSTNATVLKWLHTSPICSPGAELHNQAHGGPSLTLDCKKMTQDNAVSSSTDTESLYQPDPSPLATPCYSRPRPPLGGKIRAPCLERLLRSTESIVTRRGQGAGARCDGK